MSLGGGETQTPVADSNKYAQIMELMRRRNAMTPQSYTGGFNAFFPSSVSAVPSSYYEDMLRQQAMTNVNRGGGQVRDSAEQARINAFMDAEDARDAENGDPIGTTRYARIQNDFGSIAGLIPGVGLITSLSDAYKGFQDPRDTSDTGIAATLGRAVGGFFNTGPGYESGPNGRMSATALANLDARNANLTGMLGLPSGYDAFTSYQGVAAENAAAQAANQAMTDAANAQATADAVAQGGPSYSGGGPDGGFSPSSGEGGSAAGASARGGSGFGGTGSAVGGGSGSAAGGEGGGGGSAAGGEGGGEGGGSAAGASARSGSGFGGTGSGLYKGGKVTMDRLQGPNPMGPDDGYAGLKAGEFVINAKSVGKYGIELMNAINAGKISKGKLRGLLEV